MRRAPAGLPQTAAIALVECGWGFLQTSARLAFAVGWSFVIRHLSFGKVRDAESSQMTNDK
jgi:hypothetical protein